MEIAQKAMDMSYDGLMIETHIDPKNALSDKEQQITPLELDEILNNLIVRNFDTDDKEDNSSVSIKRNDDIYKFSARFHESKTGSIKKLLVEIIEYAFSSKMYFKGDKGKTRLFPPFKSSKN